MSILKFKRGFPIPPWIIYPELDPASDSPISDECNAYIASFSEWLEAQENATEYFNKYLHPITWNLSAIEPAKEVSEKLNLL